MFCIGEVFEGDYVFYGADNNGKLLIVPDRQRMEIIDTASNIFTARFSVDFNRETKQYNKNLIGIGIFHKHDHTFRIIESLTDSKIIDGIEVSLIEGKRLNSCVVKIDFIESNNNTEFNPEGTPFGAFNATLYKISP